MVETAGSFGMKLTPQHPAAGSMTANPQNVSAVNSSFDGLLENWFPLTYALNSLNRGMGIPDAPTPSSFPPPPSKNSASSMKSAPPKANPNSAALPRKQHSKLCISRIVLAWERVRVRVSFLLKSRVSPIY